ncbi:hypothetical protein DFQ26_005945 [Actinomortierella ambigua]|nr:hypothetical protein DFQ26_005945 [Actinomortierella ambigua]
MLSFVAATSTNSPNVLRVALPQLARKVALTPLRLAHRSLSTVTTPSLPLLTTTTNTSTASLGRIPRLTWAARTFASSTAPTRTAPAKRAASAAKTKSSSPKPTGTANADAARIRPRARLPKDPHLMSQRVLKLARQGKLEEAILQVKEAPVSLQNEVVWNHLIDEAGRLGKTNLALRLMNDMKKSSIEPTERTYTILFKALARNPSSPETAARAQGIFAQMQERDITPNLVHTNALLKVLGRTGDLEAMHRIYAKMPRQGPQAPDTITFNTVLGAYGQPMASLRTKAEAPSADETSTTTVAAMTPMTANAAADQAWKVWEECLTAKIHRPEEIHIDERLVNSLMVAVRQSASRSKHGLQVIESLYGVELLKQRGSSQTRQAKLEALKENPASMHSHRAKFPGESLGLGPLLATKMPSFWTVDLVLQLANKADQPQAGLAFVSWVEKTFAEEFVPDMKLLTTLATAFTKERRFEKTLAYLDLYHQHRLPEPSVVFFQQVLESLYGLRDKSSRAFELMKELVQLAEGGVLLRKDGRPVQGMDPIALSIYGLHCKRQGRWREGLEVLDLSQWQKVIAKSDHRKSNHGVSQLAIYVLQETLKNLKKELRRDDFNLEQQQQHPDALGSSATAPPKLMTKAEKMRLEGEILRREQELKLAHESSHRFAQERQEKARETRESYRERKRPTRSVQ